MSNPWFRMYAEFLHDPKVRTMSPENQLRLVLLFCLRCNGNVTLQDSHVTFSLRISDAEWSNTKRIFIDAGFIDSHNNVLNWNKRQFVSDSSAARVAKHRSLHKLSNVTQCNVTVTPPEQNRTDTEHNKPLSEYSDEFERFWRIYPKKTGKGGAYASWKKQKPKIELVLIALSWQIKSDSWTKENGQFCPMPSTYLNQRRWEDEQTGTKINGKLVCPKGYPFSDWKNASDLEKAAIVKRNSNEQQT